MSGTPKNLGSSWKYMPLRRESRTPPHCHPANLPGDTLKAKRDAHKQIWAGTKATWEELNQHVDPAAPRGGAVAIFPDPSGMVLVDCDVKEYYRDTGYVAQKGSVRYGDMIERVVKYGLNDLLRVARELGISNDELATYTVETKSKGLHLYYKKNPNYKLRTSGHRENWLIDIVGWNAEHNRSWAVAPPTPGYHVVRDLPVRVMPEKLAAWIFDLEVNTSPLGGKRRVQLETYVKQVWKDYGAAKYEGSGDFKSLAEHYVHVQLSFVRLADEVGGWNSTIYDTARNLFDFGLTYVEVLEPMIDAARPIDGVNRAAAEDTIRSAWKGHCRDNKVAKEQTKRNGGTA